MDSIRKSGRPSHGDRDTATFRPPRSHSAVFRRQADNLGIAYGSYVVMALSELNGLEVPDYIAEELRDAALQRRIRATEQEMDMPLSA